MAIYHDAKTSRLNLLEILKKNVCEIFFIRRYDVPFRPSDRNMLCTNSYELLNSANGKRVLNYRPPSNPLHFDPVKKSLIVTWDILQMNYRCANMTYCFLIKEYETHDEFWQTFNDKFYPMSPMDKIIWMDSGPPRI